MRRLLLVSLIAVTVAVLHPRPVWAIGDFGPDTCMEGFVWREACGPADHVCVAPQTRTGAGADNAAAKQRVQPGGGSYGPDTCKTGFVWREACGSGDHVCVDPHVRDLARTDNVQAGARKKYPYCTSSAATIGKLAVLAAQTCGPSAGIKVQTPQQLFTFCLNSATGDVNKLISDYNSQYSLCLANPH